MNLRKRTTRFQTLLSLKWVTVGSKPEQRMSITMWSGARGRGGLRIAGRLLWLYENARSAAEKPPKNIIIFAVRNIRRSKFFSSLRRNGALKLCTGLLTIPSARINAPSPLNQNSLPPTSSEKLPFSIFLPSSKSTISKIPFAVI